MSGGGGGGDCNEYSLFLKCVQSPTTTGATVSVTVDFNIHKIPPCKTLAEYERD